jgi:hypothetical protein
MYENILKLYKMNGFIACDIPKFFFNTIQLLETETKLVHIVHLKAFLFKLDNVLLLKCVYFKYNIFVESQFFARDFKPGFGTSVVHVALFRILFMSVDVLFTSV